MDPGRSGPFVELLKLLPLCVFVRAHFPAFHFRVAH